MLPSGHVPCRSQKAPEDVILLQTRLSSASVELALVKLQLQQQEAESAQVRQDLQNQRADSVVKAAEQVQDHCIPQCTCVQRARCTRVHICRW